MAVNIPIYDGNPTFVSGSSTPNGTFDNDVVFQQEAPKLAKKIAQRLGYPIIEIELSSEMLFTCIEEAVEEYSFWVNSYNAKNNLFSTLGQPLTGSDFNSVHVKQNVNEAITLAREYGSILGLGGDVSVYTGSIEIVPNQQYYNLNELFRDIHHPNKNIVVHRIHHHRRPAFTTGHNSIGNFMYQLGSAYNTYGTSYNMYPLSHDVLNMQFMELHNEIRTPYWSFRVINNNLQLWPIPRTSTTLWFDYTLDDERRNPVRDMSSTISDYSNIPYKYKTYAYINSIGKKWIENYARALAEETLGWVRSKYSSIPIPNGDVSMNGSDLVSSGQSKQENLISEIKELLESMSYKQMMEDKTTMTEQLQEQLKYIPNMIYIG